MRRVRTIATNGTLDVDFDRAVPIRTILLTMTTLAAEVACVITQCAIEDSQFLQLFCLVLLVCICVWIDHHRDLVGCLVHRFLRLTGDQHVHWFITSSIPLS